MAVQLVKHADAEPADGLLERKLVLGQLGQRINQRVYRRSGHHRVTTPMIVAMMPDGLLDALATAVCRIWAVCWPIRSLSCAVIAF